MGKIMMNGHQYGVGGLERAEDISYDNTSSGMSATNVQGALDEVKAGLTNIKFENLISSPITLPANSTGITGSLISGKKFDDYNMINVTVFDSTYIRASATLCRNSTLGDFTALIPCMYAGAVSQITFRQPTKTSISVDNNAGGAFQIMIRGIRLG